MGESHLKYLDMLQTIISRLSGNQFTARAWSVTLGTAVIGYAVSKDSLRHWALLAILPTLCFWVQDAYYLGLERAFRDLFRSAVKNGQNGPLFQFDAAPTPGAFILAGIAPAVVLLHLPVIVIAFLVGRG
jgi:hypothetical protein